MDAERQRIQDDLRGLIRGDVRCDDVFLQLYATDASIYEIRPLGVVRPRNTADVAACMQYAAEKRIPVQARGAGTGLAGESLGRGLVIDFSRYMRRIVRIDGDQVRVQPGMVHAVLNQHLAASGRLFGPDPAMSLVTTIGSVVAIDASGSHWLQYGSARRHVQSLQVVLADGTVCEVGREPIPAADDISATASPPSSRQELVRRLHGLLTQHAQLIADRRPKTLQDRSGYQLSDLLDADSLHLERLLCGSEGTLALITEATLSTVAAPRYRGVGILFFESLERAAQAVQEILRFDPCACDLLDRRHLSLARENYPEYALLVPPETEALLLVEQSGDDPAVVRDRLTQTVDRVRRRKHLAFDARQAFDREEIELYWQLARRVVPSLHRLKGSTRPLPFVEDLAIPPAALLDFLVRLQNTLKRHQVTASLYGHVGHGQLHVRPFLDLTNAEDVRKMEDLAADLYREVFEVGGTISGEHGDGLSRTPFIRQQFGELYDVFREVKQIFDPQGILNPGKIVGDEGRSLTRDLRPQGPVVIVANSALGGANGPVKSAPINGPEPQNGAALPIGEPLELHLNWTTAEMAVTARGCNGCGSCRAQSNDLRMCPIFRANPAEEASPRAKANLIRGVVAGKFDAAILATDEMKEVADLCVNCHQCRLECPAGVDVPKLMIEAKAAHVATNGLSASDWLLARFDLLSKWGSRFSPLANWAVGNRQARWVLEKTLGITQGRKLPRFAATSFLRLAARRRLTKPTRRSGRKVLYFVDTYANHHDPKLAEALVAVLEHNGIAVYVPPNQYPSGMGMISMGVVEPARRLAAKNIPLLAEAIRQGYQIVVTEPSTALCLTHEYLNLIDDDDARLVAGGTVEACSYLWRLHQNGNLQLDFQPVNAALAYHMPCHSKALIGGESPSGSLTPPSAPAENLLRLIPALDVQRLEKGCSGMAGTYGLKRANYRNSIRAGWDLISSMRRPEIQAGATECSACKMQMEEGSNKPTLHPLKVLALAYGLMPELAGKMSSRGDDSFVT